MKTKKKRNLLMIGIPAIIIFITIVVLFILYLTTDMFKSNQTLFFKYLGKNTDNLLQIKEIFNDTQYSEFYNSSKYNKNSEFNINYVENYETTSENTSNSINNLKLTLDEDVDSENNYRYGKLELLNKEKSLAQIDLIKDNDTYGIGFPELIKQYLLIENEDLKEKLGETFNFEEIDSVLDKFDIKIIKDMKFSDEELEKLKSKYLNLISGKISKDKFSKKTNQKLNINENTISTNEYKLTLTKEQINDIFLDVLQTIKEDETILNKIEQIKNAIPEGMMQEDLKQVYVSSIENIIEEINKNNIGTEEISIAVYERKGTTLKTLIQTPKNQIELDFLNNGQEKYGDILISQNEKLTNKIILKQKDNDIECTVENYINGETQTITLKINNEINDNEAIKKISTTYIYDANKVDLNYYEKIRKSDQIDKRIEFDDKNSIHLSKLEQDKANEILNKVINTISEKAISLAAEIKITDIQIMLKNIGLISDVGNIDTSEISEVQKKRFNSELEILQGEELYGERILQIIDIIGDSITNLEVVSNMELRIELNKGHGNEELTKILKDFLEKNKSRKYSVAVEYDENTGLVNNLMLTLIKRDR